MENNTFKGLWAFVVLCAYICGAIGSIGYAFYAKANFVGICSIAVAAMALPYVIKTFKNAEIL